MNSDRRKTVLIGRNGVKEIPELSLSDDENEKFRASAALPD